MFDESFPTMDLASMKNLELDKICRVCLAVKKDMRPLFGEMIADMLMECASVQIENVDGWPDKICLQCIHQVSRCHAFKTRVEKSDLTLRQYIKGITVIVEEHQIPKEMTITQIEVQRPNNKQHQLQRAEIQHVQQVQQAQLQEIQIQRTDLQQANDNQQHPMIVTNTQLLNNGAQIINAGQILTTANGQQMIQTTPHFQATTAQIGQLIQGPNNTVQMITHNGHPAQVLQIQRTSDDRCEIIVQPDMSEAQYYEDIPVVMTTQNNLHTQHQHHQQQEQQQEQQQQQIELKDVDDHQHHHQTIEIEDETLDQEQILDDEQNEDEEYIVQSDGAESESEEKQHLAEFMTFQTSCPSPGRHVCNLCHKEFSQARWLQTHMSSHANWIKANCKKQPQCEICHRSFRGPGMLKMHMKTHEKSNKMPTCTICNKEFKTKSILYRHRQTHFEQKPHKCTICSKNFNSNYQLNSHMARHRGEKTFKCPHCDKSFYNASDLKNHVQQHLGIKIIQIKKVSANS